MANLQLFVFSFPWIELIVSLILANTSQEGLTTKVNAAIKKLHTLSKVI